MKAVIARDWCDPKDLKVEEVPTPQPKKGDVLIRVGSAALNFPDILMIQGKYQVKPPSRSSPAWKSPARSNPSARASRVSSPATA
jgi:NADPH:quinone reductase